MLPLFLCFRAHIKRWAWDGLWEAKSSGFLLPSWASSMHSSGPPPPRSLPSRQSSPQQLSSSPASLWLPWKSRVQGVLGHSFSSFLLPSFFFLNQNYTCRKLKELSSTMFRRQQLPSLHCPLPVAALPVSGCSMLTCILSFSWLGLHPLAFWAWAPCPRGENPRLFLPLCPHTPHLSSQLRCSFWFAALGHANRAELSWGSLCLSCAHFISPGVND